MTVNFLYSGHWGDLELASSLVFHLNFKNLHVKITNLLRVVV